MQLLVLCALPEYAQAFQHDGRLQKTKTFHGFQRLVVFDLFEPQTGEHVCGIVGVGKDRFEMPGHALSVRFQHCEQRRPV